MFNAKGVIKFVTFYFPFYHKTSSLALGMIWKEK